MITEKHPIYRIVKRFLDILLSAALLCFLSPLMLLIAIFIRLDSEGHAIFKQSRIGKDGKSFICYKFRTMYKTAPANSPKSTMTKAEAYITPVGKVLRRTSLDELPQLYNVLRGDMSIVGPRPLILEEGEIHELRRRCGVTLARPGITGLAQVSGRNNITWEQKMEYDLQYINGGITLLGDIKIILKTVVKVLKRSDTVREGTVSDMDFGDWLMTEGKIDQDTYDEKQKEAKELMKV